MKCKKCGCAIAHIEDSVPDTDEENTVWCIECYSFDKYGVVI